MGFTIVRNDITRVQADAIVNTANPQPVIGAGTDAAVHAAAGPQLLAARKEIGAIAVGSSKETPAFALPAKFVLHTVSPAWQDGAHGEPALLDQAYRSALTLAEKLHCRSVAFPLLSAGSYGFPHEIALDIAIRAFNDFLSDHDLEIILVVFNKEATALAGSLFDDLKSYIDDRYVGKAMQTEYPRGVLRRRADFAGTASTHALQAKPYRDESECCLFDAAPAPVVFENKIETGSRKSARLEELLQQTESSFSEHLLSLLNECGEKDSAVYRRAQISRQLFHKILSQKNYQPTKSTAIQLALGLRLDLSQTQTLLNKAGFALSRSSKADLVVQYFIEHGEYSVITINTALFDCGLPLLKTGSAS